MNKVLIIGGGAAGMMAAIAAKNEGADVLILERNNRLGRKILATGNGRCNYTNINMAIDNYHGTNPKFAYSPLSKFGVSETMDFFEQLGIAPFVEEEGRVFPLSLQSSSVLDVLRYELHDLNIDIMLGAYVVDIEKNENFQLTLADGKKIYGDKVILTTGGKAAPNMGSDGNGYILGQKMNHKLIKPFQGLVQLELEGSFFKEVDGVKLDGKVGLYSEGSLIREDSGDVLFRTYGISGPPILQLSRTALEYIEESRDIELRVAIISSKNEEELYEYLYYRFAFMPRKTIEVALIGLINKRLILPILKEINIDKYKNVGNLSNDEVRNLAKILTDLRFKIKGGRSWEEAQVTAGGISTEEIDNSTMESKLVEGLYFAGELVDIDGDCGGFNLQWAWSSAYIAGINAAII